MTKPHVGIDVAKDQLDVWVWETETGDSVPHNEAGIEALCARLEALAPDRIVVEATGGREVPLAAALQAAGLPVAVVNPRQARAFGRALGQLAKTDCLDARLLARMAAVLRPPVRPLPDADLRALRAVVVRRRQIAAMGAQEKTRLERAPSDLQPRIRAHLEWLQAELTWERTWEESGCTRRRLARASATAASRRAQTPFRHQRRKRRKTLFQ